MLLERINEQYHTQYAAHIVPSEHTRVDSQGISSVSNEEPLQFQVTYADNGLPHEGGSVLGKRFRGASKQIIDLTTPYDVAAAIARKQEHYGKKEAEKLILIIWKTKSCIIEPTGVDWQEDRIWFQGCYFVCLPGGGTPGQIVTIKPYRSKGGQQYLIT